MKVSVYNQKAEVIGDVELNSKIFEVKPNEHLLAEATRIHRSNSRQGTSSTKTRGEVRGGGKKPWKQKGTGRARAGSTRSPIWRHGGVVFGPRPDQNWELKMNKKAKRKALFMSLTDKAQHNQLIVIDHVELPAVKTKEFISIVKVFEKSVKGMGKKKLFVIPVPDEKVARASRNIPFVLSTVANKLNIMDILKADTVVMFKDSLPALEKTFLKNS